MTKIYLSLFLLFLLMFPKLFLLLTAGIVGFFYYLI